MRFGPRDVEDGFIGVVCAKIVTKPFKYGTFWRIFFYCTANIPPACDLKPSHIVAKWPHISAIIDMGRIWV